MSYTSWECFEWWTSSSVYLIMINLDRLLLFIMPDHQYTCWYIWPKTQPLLNVFKCIYNYTCWCTCSDKFHSDAPDQIYQQVITVPAVPEVLVQANSTCWSIWHTIKVYMHSTQGTQYIGYLRACISTASSLNWVCLVDGIVGIPVVAFPPTVHTFTVCT